MSSQSPAAVIVEQVGVWHEGPLTLPLGGRGGVHSRPLTAPPSVVQHASSTTPTNAASTNNGESAAENSAAPTDTATDYDMDDGASVRSAELGAGGKVPKPRGEAGRPDRGGYNLHAKLGWTKHHYARFRVRRLFFAMKGLGTHSASS